MDLAPLHLGIKHIKIMGFGSMVEQNHGAKKKKGPILLQLTTKGILQGKCTQMN